MQTQTIQFVSATALPPQPCFQQKLSFILKQTREIACPRGELWNGGDEKKSDPVPLDSTIKRQQNSSAKGIDFGNWRENREKSKGKLDTISFVLSLESSSYS